MNDTLAGAMPPDPSLSERDTVDLRRDVPPQPAASLEPDIAAGSVLAHRYALVQPLGSGGMGQVYKALDWQRRFLPEAERHVAVKILHRKAAEAPELLADLRREFYCAQSLSHPNIVKVFELAREDDAAFFTMELLEGESLGTRLNRTRPRPPSRTFAWRVIRDIGLGVAHAHARQVVHGDLKPQNIMITAAGEVRILDFGASGSLRQSDSRDPHALQRNRLPAVTPAYTCCELLAGQQADPRDDLYALGCIAYELLTGRHPFDGRSSVSARDQGLEPRRPRGITRRQWRALRQGLAWQREQRNIPVGEWLHQLGLESAEASPPSIGRPSTSMMRPSVALPTGTEIAAPVLLTAMPRRRPSDEPSAMVRTTPSPSCCCTSKVRPASTPACSADLSSVSASYTLGIALRGNSMSTTAPMH